MSKPRSIIPIGKIGERILLIHGEKVIIDADLAEFYGVPTKRLNEQVKRNAERFPGDFMFQLVSEEKAEVVANCDHLAKLKYSKALPYAFNEHGAIMAASVLNSPRAVQVSVFIVRAFVQLRRTLAESKELAGKLTRLERKLANHDHQIIAIIQAIKELADPKELPKKRRIGFTAEGHDE